MKKLLLPLLMLSGISAFAQPTITQAQFPLSVGDVRSTYAGTFQVPTTGASQTWNFTSWPMGTATTVNIVDPSTSGITGLPASTVCYNAAVGSYDCYLIDATGMFRTGIAGSGVTMAYNNSERVLTFPITMNNLSVDNFRVNSYMAGTYPAHRSGTDSTEVVGYGTLNLPGSISYTNAMLVRTAQHYKDSVDYGGFYVVLNSDYTTYNFYVAGEEGSVATITSGTNTLAGASQTASYSVNGASSGVESFDISNNLSLYPNPADEYFTLTNNSNIDMNGYGYSIVNMNGQTVKTGIINADNMNFDVSELASGLYVLNINSNDFNAAKRFIKN